MTPKLLLWIHFVIILFMLLIIAGCQTQFEKCKMDCYKQLGEQGKDYSGNYVKIWHTSQELDAKCYNLCEGD